jgi:hypothetical protein
MITAREAAAARGGVHDHGKEVAETFLVQSVSSFIC